jgi:hypothetical protein
VQVRKPSPEKENFKHEARWTDNVKIIAGKLSEMYSSGDETL